MMFVSPIIAIGGAFAFYIFLKKDLYSQLDLIRTDIRDIRNLVIKYIAKDTGKDEDKDKDE